MMNFDFNADIILENDAVLLRPVNTADVVHLLPAATSDKLLIQYSPKQIYSKELLTGYIETAIASRMTERRYTFSIFSKTAGCYAGSTAFMNISNADDRLEVGATWLDKKFQGTGLNRQCKYLLLTYAFDVIGANRVEFKTDERNLQSQRAIEKIGGRFEGMLREHTVMYDGFRRNTFCYSMLKHEWNAVKDNFFAR